MKRYFLFFVIVLAVSAVGISQVPPGVGAASFARIGVDARPLAMGGAFVAVGQGTPIPYYNPAGLVRAGAPTIDGLYSEPFGHEFGIAFQNLSILGGLGMGLQTDSRNIGVGVTWIGMQIKDILVWDENDPTVVESFTATSSLYLASVAFPLLDDWAVGISAKLYRERILDGRGEGFGVDVGVLGSFWIGDMPVNVGINSMDLGQTTIAWRETIGEPDNYVPWVNKIGVSTSFLDGAVLLALDYDWAVGRPVREQIIHIGAEYHPFDIVALRAGWSGDVEEGGSFGAGAGIHLLGRFMMDYAYVTGGALGGTHYVSMQFSF